MLRLSLRVFRAPDDLLACERYSRSHREVLEYFDIGGVTSAGRGWFYDPNVLVVLLDDLASGEALGGIRLERAGGARPLPLEVALAKTEPYGRWRRNPSVPRGSAELCALFSSRRLRGAGMGRFLTRIGLALAVERRISKLFGVCDSRSLEANLALGFAVDSARGDHGTLRYPRPDLTAHVLSVELESWSVPERPEHEVIREFREARAGVSTRRSREGILSVAWDLDCPDLEITNRERTFVGAGARF